MTKLLVLQCAVIVTLLFMLGCAAEPPCPAPRFVMVAHAPVPHGGICVVTLDTCQGHVVEHCVGGQSVPKPLPQRMAPIPAPRPSI